MFLNYLKIFLIINYLKLKITSSFQLIYFCTKNKNSKYVNLNIHKICLDINKLRHAIIINITYILFLLYYYLYFALLSF